LPCKKIAYYHQDKTGACKFIVTYEFKMSYGILRAYPKAGFFWGDSLTVAPIYKLLDGLLMGWDSWPAKISLSTFFKNL
jgi:hypothetical protein